AVESFAFDRTALDALSAELAQQQQQELYLRIGAGVAAGLVVLALLFFILRLISNTRNASKETWKPVMLPVGEVSALGEPDYKVAAMKLQDDLSQALSRLAEKDGGTGSVMPMNPKVESNEDVVVQLRSKTARSSDEEQNARIITRLTEENPATVAEIIQIWLNEGKKS
ncbi:MAG: hypothetical protein KAX86_04780, partial [Anaerolineales bacterium]|nr:hypothetical protein [Anaerolineales bacterium]